RGVSRMAAMRDGLFSTAQGIVYNRRPTTRGGWPPASATHPCRTPTMAEAAPLAPKQPESFSPGDYSVTVEPSGKRVKVLFGGQVVADSRRALVLKETRLPPVYYLPREDVAMDFLVPSDHRTYCPFKGTASYWSLAVGDKTLENVAWSYEDPI